jgi:cardiolipin synthase
MNPNWPLLGFCLNAIFFLILLVMVFTVPRNRKPSSAIAWLLLIALVPVFGLLLFWMFGRTKLPKRRREQQHAMDEWVAARVARARRDPEVAPLLAPAIPPHYQPFAQLNANLGILPVVGGNRVELVAGYDDFLQRLTADIENAQRYVHLEFFALCRDDETEPVFQALERAARRGVKVRVLMDHYGSLVYFFPYRATRRSLTRAGIEHHVMLPLGIVNGEFPRLDLRNHRKLAVIDGVCGYLGSHNLIRRNYFRTDEIVYDELAARVAGPVVAELEAVFATDWHAETGVFLAREQFPELEAEIRPCGEMLAQVLPSGPGHVYDNNLKLFVALCYAAQRKLVLVTPYFVPDDSFLLALTTAAQRGVEVILINSEAEDQFFTYHAQRSYYEALLQAGVKIYLHRPPTLVHTKSISVDDDIAVIGSSNLDIRSFRLSLEVTLVIPDQNVVADLRRVEAEYLRRSTPLELERWLERPLGARLPQNVARLTASLQ